MREFFYKAKKGIDSSVEGTIEAEGAEDAVNRLVAAGLFPVTVEPVIAKNTGKKNKGPAFRLSFLSTVRKKNIHIKDLLVFTQKLATLTRAKVELFASLKVLSDQTEQSLLKEVIQDLISDTKEGKVFSESLARHPEIFPPLYINIIRSGEASGRLDKALDQINEFMEREEGLKGKILVAMAYPAVLLGVGLVSIFVLINFVIPKLKSLLEGLGEQLPFITRCILRMSEISRSYWIWIAGSLAGISLFLYFEKGAPFLRNRLRSLRSRLPVIGRIVKTQELTHFSRSLGLLLANGVSALTALEIATLTIGNERLKGELRAVYQYVAEGGRLSQGMRDMTKLPPFFVKMIAVGEESGKLGEVLEEISKSYTRQLESDIALVSALIEPVLILTLGLILGTIVLAILLPTFQVTQMVR